MFRISVVFRASLLCFLARFFVFSDMRLMVSNVLLGQENHPNRSNTLTSAFLHRYSVTLLANFSISQAISRAVWNSSEFRMRLLNEHGTKRGAQCSPNTAF